MSIAEKQTITLPEKVHHHIVHIAHSFAMYRQLVYHNLFNSGHIIRAK